MNYNSKHSEGRLVPCLKKTAVASLLTGALVSGCVLSGCSAAQTDSAEVSGTTEQTEVQTDDTTANNDVAYDTFEQVAAAFDVQALDLDYSKRDTDPTYDEAAATHIVLGGAAAEVEGAGALADGVTVTINTEGTYVVSGELTDGQLVVEAPEDAKVQIVFDGVTLHNETGPALYVKQADKCFITLAEGSDNKLSDGTEYVLEDGSDEPSATVFARADLTLNGSGSLRVDASYDNGIYSKDDLVITGGEYEVNAAGDALRGRDCVKIADGIFDLTAGADGIKSNKDTKQTQGFVSIDGGEFSIDAQDDGIQGKTYVRVGGGQIDITAADDAIHSDLEGALQGGNITIDAGDDAFHAETKLVVDEGNVDIVACVEGYEAQEVIVNGGNSYITASDDALNAAVADLSDDETSTDQATTEDPGAMAPEGAPEPPAGEMPADGQMPTDGQMPADNQMPTGEFPADGGGRGGFGGRGDMAGGMSEVSEDCLLQINGGVVIINAGGDGVDSNGNLEIKGGIVLVNEPDSGADSALDYELSATVSGGTVLMVGAAGMAETFTGGDQPFLSAMASGQAGQNVAIVDDQGNVLVSLNAAKSFGQVIASTPQMSEGTTYSVVVGGTPQNADEDGYADSGTLSGGNATEAVASTTPSQNAGMGGMGGGRGGMGGMRG